MKKITLIIIGVLMVAALGSSVSVLAQEEITKELVEKDIVRTEALVYADGRIERLSPAEYLQRKQLLQNDYVANKTAKTGYDFDVNNLPLLEAVLEKESKARGEVNLVGATKDDIREYILGLVGITP